MRVIERNNDRGNVSFLRRVGWFYNVKIRNGSWLLTSILISHWMLCASQVDGQEFFDAFGRARVNWSGETQEDRFGERYANQANFEFSADTRLGNGLEFLESEARYDLELFGSSFGVANELAKPLGNTDLFSVNASSGAEGQYRVPSLAGRPEFGGRITTARAVIPIHGELGLYDGSTGGSGAIISFLSWGFEFRDGGTGYNGSGSLVFESQYLAAPTVTRNGEYASLENLSLTSFDDRRNPILDNDTLMGYDLDGLVVVDFSVDLAEGDAFEVAFDMGSILSSSDELVYGNANYFNSSAYELYALDSSGNVVSDFAFQPVAVPEPSSFALGGLALLGLVCRRNRCR